MQKDERVTRMWVSGLSALGLCVVTSTVSAVTLTAVEHFDYGDGMNIEGQTGGTGWTGGWSSDSDGTFTASTPGLSYPGVDASGNLAVIAPGSATSTYYRDLSATLSDGDIVYVGFLGQKTVADDDTRYFGVALFEGSSEKILVGQGSGFANWTVNKLNSVYSLPTETLESATSSQDEAYVLARIDLRPGVETVTYWVNPDFSKSELENTAVGGTSYVTEADYGTVSRVRVGGGGTSTSQAASTHLLDELLITTDSPFAAGNTKLFYDDGEDTVEGAEALPLFGTYNPHPYTQRVATAGGNATPAGNVVPTTAVGDGSNFMIVDRDAGNIGRRNYGAFTQPASGVGVVRVEGDFYLDDGQLQFGLGSDQSGYAIDGTTITLGLNLNADGSIRAYGSNAIVSGASFDVDEWEHFVLEYELGADIFTFEVNGASFEVALPLGDPVTEMSRVWITAGTSSTTGYYDNLDVTLVVPEPGTLALIGTGLVLVLRRKRHG